MRTKQEVIKHILSNPTNFSLGIASDCDEIWSHRPYHSSDHITEVLYNYVKNTYGDTIDITEEEESKLIELL